MYTEGRERRIGRMDTQGRGELMKNGQRREERTVQGREDHTETIGQTGELRTKEPRREGGMGKDTQGERQEYLELKRVQANS